MTLSERHTEIDRLYDKLDILISQLKREPKTNHNAHIQKIRRASYCKDMVSLVKNLRAKQAEFLKLIENEIDSINQELEE